MKYLVILLLLMLGGMSSVTFAQEPTELPINGAFLDADGDDIPDGWTGHDLAVTDGVKCKSVCSYIFAGSTVQRMLSIMVDAPESFTPPGKRITLTTDIKFSSVGAGSYFQILGMLGKHLTTNYLMIIPEGVNQKRKLTISGVVQDTGVDRFYIIVRVTGGKLKLTDAHLTVEPATVALPSAEPAEKPTARCNPTGISEWRLNKERVIYDDYHGWVMKCYYNAPGDIMPPDTKQLCPAELHNQIDADVPHTQHWTNRQKFAIHVDPLRVRCVYTDYSVTYPSQ